MGNEANTLNDGEADHLRVLQERLSAERLRKYRRPQSSTLRDMVRLYDWNTSVSAACFADLTRIEVVLRNALHDRLTGWYRGPGQWFDDASIFDRRGVADIAAARYRLIHPETPGRVVAELNFGFWRYLLAARYEKTLWTPVLRHAFPHLKPQRRRTVADQVRNLHHLRNRIAHCEPVFHRDLARDHRSLLEVTGYICPEAQVWIARNTSVPQLLSQCPGVAAQPIPTQTGKRKRPNRSTQ